MYRKKSVIFRKKSHLTVLNYNFERVHKLIVRA